MAADTHFVFLLKINDLYRRMGHYLNPQASN
jgi:hypothetical protein